MAPLGRISWMGQVDAVLASVSDMLYSWGLMWLLIGAGIFFTVRTRGVQVRHTDAIAASVIGSRDGSHGGITSFQAFAVGLACRVGTGNIVGVALALILGGPGAVLWMWLVAILGTATAFSEATLAQLFKVRRPDGTFRGGPAYYISRGLGLPILGGVFAVVFLIANGLVMPMVQANAITASLQGAGGLSPSLGAVLVVALTAPVLLGGLRAMARVAEYLAPFMALAYLVLVLAILLTHPVQALEAEKDEMEAELRALTDKPSPLEREEHENQVLQGDLAKFVKYHHEVLVPKLDKSRRTIQRLHAAWDEYSSELRDKQQERERRQKLVDTQDVSSEEFERLVSEREWLARQLEELRVQNREAMEQCWSLEMALSKRQADVEKRLQVFHTGQQRIHLLPLSLPNGVELSELELVPAHPTTMLAPGVTMEAVRAKIETMRAAEVDSFRRLSDERVALQEAVDELLERLERTRRSTRSLEMRHESLREQIDEMGRISSAEEDESGAEYMRQEHLVNSMEHASSMALQQADTRVKALQLQLQEALESTADERAAMHEEICRALHTLLDLKVRVGKGLDAVTSAVHGVMRA